MAQFNATHEAFCESERIARARAKLRAQEQRTSSVHQNQRDFKRMPYDGQPVVALECVKADGATELITFLAWGVDISRSGMSFVVPGELTPSLAGEDSVILRLPNLLQPNLELTLGMLQNTGFRMWLATQVVHFRPTHEQLYQCTVKIVGRRAGLLV
ncbi:MAG TPA: hypothetical protein VFE24_08095 [Pirellulales bacterium]|jgi:hypothetical protein|nr:hypothetical protein [Pirellulales bacterium]